MNLAGKKDSLYIWDSKNSKYYGGRLNQQSMFHRLQLLTGEKTIKELWETKVVVFGVGGVGSWCAEALIRSGVGSLTIVDSDLICVTNINRQVQATADTVGLVKVTALKEYLSSISPNADIRAIQKVYNRDTSKEFNLSEYDYTIDAIDSLSCKVELIVNAVNSDTTLYTALGASGKLDPTKIQVDSIWKSRGCRLGRFVRKRLRKRGVSEDFLCVYQDELLPVHEAEIGCGTGDCVCPSPEDGIENHEWCSSKKQINGSVVHITGTFGFILSGLVIQNVVEKCKLS